MRIAPAPELTDSLSCGGQHGAEDSGPDLDSLQIRLAPLPRRRISRIHDY